MRISRRTIYLAPLLVVLLPLVGCRTNQSQQETVPTKSSVVASDKEAALVGLAHVAYTGSLVEGPDSQVAQQIEACVVHELERQPATSNRYTLVWGPVVRRIDDSDYDDNMMFVVRDNTNPEELVVALRGTVPVGLVDWLREDLNVLASVPWATAAQSGDEMPRITAGTHLGLEILKEMRPSESLPGAGTTLTDFLASEAKAGTLMQISVVGHSLGGALASTLALYLHDVQDLWAPDLLVKFDVMTLAAPSIGNQAYSGYYVERLGDETTAWQNSLDIAVKFWDANTIALVKDMYAGGDINTPEYIGEAADVLIDFARTERYQQLLPTAIGFSGTITPTQTNFADQALWQHRCGYYCGLGISDALLGIDPLCDGTAASQKPFCEVCPVP